MRLKVTSSWTEIRRCSIKCSSTWGWTESSRQSRLTRKSRACSRMSWSIGASTSRIFQLSIASRLRNLTINLHPNFSLVSQFRHIQIRWTNIKIFGADLQIDNRLGHTISITISPFRRTAWKTWIHSGRASRSHHHRSTWCHRHQPACPCWIRIYRDSSGNTPSSKRNFTRISNCRSNSRNVSRTRTTLPARWSSRISSTMWTTTTYRIYVFCNSSRMKLTG